MVFNALQHIARKPLVIKELEETFANIVEHSWTPELKTVNLLAYAYAGSNPALPTTFILSELKTKAPPQRRGFFFGCTQNVVNLAVRSYSCCQIL